MKKIIFLLTLLLPAMAYCQLSVGAGATLVATNGTRIVLSDLDLNNAGQLDATGSTFHFTGAANSTITGGPIAFYNVTVNKTTGKQVSLGTSITADGVIQFLSGNIDLAGHNIGLNATGSVLGESETARIFGSTGGSITATPTLGALNAVNVANLGLMLTTSVPLGLTTITRTHQPADLVGHPGILRTFEVAPANNTGLNATIGFHYLDAELNGLNETQLTVYQRSAGLHYNDIGYTTRDIIGNTVTKSGLQSFDKFSLGMAGAVLPVRLTRFAGQCMDGYVRLDWETASEQNSDRFEVWRSVDGRAWERIGVVQAAGNVATARTYHYDDHTLAAASAFYRLAEYDRDGSFTYSAIVKAGCGNTTEFSVSPNPVSTTARIVISGGTAGAGSLQLYNAGGQLVWRQATGTSAGINQYTIDMSAWPAGTYTLLYTDANGRQQTSRLLKR